VPAGSIAIAYIILFLWGLRLRAPITGLVMMLGVWIAGSFMMWLGGLIAMTVNNRPLEGSMLLSIVGMLISTGMFPFGTFMVSGQESASFPCPIVRCRS